MSHIRFLNTAEESDFTYLAPWIELTPRSSPNKSAHKHAFPLPEPLVGLSDPSPEESIALVRYIALHIARSISVTTEMSSLAWYQSYYESVSFDDYLEVAAAVLAGLNTSIVTTTTDGHIVVDFRPHIDDCEIFLLEKFVPIAHYIREFDPENDGEVDLDNVFVGNEAIKRVYSLVNFFRTNRIINLDAVLHLRPNDDGDAVVVAARKYGTSELQPSRNFDQPRDRVLLCIMGVLHFFKYSSEYGELFAGFSDDYDPSIEELERDKLDYIEEFPDEADVAEEIFVERAEGLRMDWEFLSDSAALNSLGITSIESIGNNVLRATLFPSFWPLDPNDDRDVQDIIGDDHEDPFVDNEPVGLIQLGIYEAFFFDSDE